MRTLLVAAIALAAPEIALAAENGYCAQLKAAGLENKRVVVNPADGREGNAVHGILDRIEADWLVIKPAPASDKLRDEDGQLIEPERTLTYINCDRVYSVVVTEGSGSPPVIRIQRAN